MRSKSSRPFTLLICLVVSLPIAGLPATVSIGPNKEVLLDGKPFFPIMTWLQNASRIATEKTYGINTFVGQGDNSTALAYCNEAQAQGVYAVPSWNAPEIASVKAHPAMLGWVFGDEPDLQGNNIPPSAIKLQYDSIKAADSDHITFLTITSGFYSGDALPAWMNGSDSMYYSYPKFTDVIGFDYYPVYGWCRPDWIYKVGGSQDELVSKYCKGTKSTYQWIECVATSGQWCSIPARGTDDGPYPYEVKDEVWLAIVKGANSIGYFTHSWKCPGYSQCCVSDSQIAMLKQVNGQITALTSVLCGADSKAAVTVQTNDPKGSIAFRVKEYNGSLYIFAVDVIEITGAKDTQQVTVTVPGLQGPVTVYDEERTITPNGTSFSDTFLKINPVHIYVSSTTATIQQKIQAYGMIRPLRVSYSGRASSVKFFVQNRSSGIIRIYSCSGTLLRTMNTEAGAATWDCRDESGKKVAAGIYHAATSGSQKSVIPVLVR
ncbi:MAG TPA: hypothetical protein VLX68_17595 [Chitinivibrionales bacterium]|nr:hypothetical protein [Chitinivibrionales bacterium]